MRPVIQHLLSFLPVAAAMIFLHCNDGGNILIVDSKVSGVMYDEEGKPASGATVIMRPRDYLPEARMVSKRSARATAPVCSTTTDRHGRYAFGKVAEGIYIFEGISSDGKESGFVDSVVFDARLLQDDTCFQLDPVTLKPAAAIRGTVLLCDSASGTVYIYGFENTATIDSNGHFLIRDLPEGNHRLQVVVNVNDQSSYDSLAATTTARDTLIIDSIVTSIGTPPFIEYLSDTLMEVAAGATCTLTVVADGSPEIRYQWHKDGELLDSVPEGKVVIAGATPSDEGTYRCLVMNQWGEATSKNFEVVVVRLNTVLYNGNGNTGGTVPVDERVYSTGDTVAVMENSGNLVRKGFTFAGWNDRWDGSGELRLPGAVFEKGPSEVVLYAQWTEKRYFLTVAKSGHGTVCSSDSVAHGSPYTITARSDGGSSFTVWRVTEGTATIADSTADSTAIVLEDGDAVVTAVFIQNGLITFEKTMGDYDLIEDGRFVQQTDDGGYIITGLVLVGGNYDACLIKTDPYGDTLWTGRFGDAALFDEGACVRQTTDGGYIIAGSTEAGVSDSSDVFIVKTDENGNEVWSRSFGGEHNDYGRSVQQTSDGGYIIGAVTGSFGAGYEDFYLIKTDATGDTVWTRTFGGESQENPVSAQQTTDGGYIIGGTTLSFGGADSDIYLVKTDENGDTVWTRVLGGAANEDGYYVQQTNDGGYIVAGYTTDQYETKRNDTYLIKTDADGHEEWSTSFGTALNEGAYSIQQTSDGGYIMTGFVQDLDTGVGPTDLYLVRADAGGNVVWSKTFGGIAGDIGKYAQQTNDGGFIVIGHTTPLKGDVLNPDQTNWDIYLIKTDENGMVERAP